MRQASPYLFAAAAGVAALALGAVVVTSHGPARAEASAAPKAQCFNKAEAARVATMGGGRLYMLVNNRDVIKDGLLSFKTYTATLAGKGDEIERVLGKADTAFASFDNTIARIDSVLPDLTKGKDGELYQKVKTIHELADSFNKRSAAFMEEGRRSLLDISEAATKVTRKFDGPGPRR